MICRHTFTTSIALFLTLAALQVLADPKTYAGTATLCLIGAVPPSVKQTDKDGVDSVSGLVGLYYIDTTPAGIDPPSGLVNGWELLTSDLQIIGDEFLLEWKGVLIPTAYADTTGTVLRETRSIRTKDLSTLSGTWQGTGDLAGTRVDYVLKMIPGGVPDCPGESPSQCAEIEGGCLPAKPPAVERPIVYQISGVVN